MYTGFQKNSEKKNEVKKKILSSGGGYFDYRWKAENLSGHLQTHG